MPCLTPRPILPLLPSVPITPHARPTDTQVVVVLSTQVTIQNFAQLYPSASPDSFQPIYHAIDDGSLVAPPLLDDLRISNIFLIIIGCLLSIFLRNSFISAIYAWRGKVKKKGLFYILFLSQLLGPFAIILIIAAQLDRSADCAVISRIISITSGVSLSLLLTGILGVKVYRCLDNSRFVLAGLAVLSTTATAVLVLDAVNLRSLRSLSGRCYRPSAGLYSVFVMLLLAESFFICACFLHVVWKSHGPVAVRGRISIHLSPDDESHGRPARMAPSTRVRRRWFDGPSAGFPIMSPQNPSLLREPSPTFTHHKESATMDTMAPSIGTDQSPKCTDPFPCTPHPHVPRSHTVKMPITTAHSSMAHFTRYISRMSLFKEVMKDELCYTAVMTAFTVVSVAMTLVGVKSAGGINATIWVILDWALISLLVMHSFGRVIQRHENESLFLQPSVWCHDLHTDRTTAELLQDVPHAVRTSRMPFKARARRSVARYDKNCGACGASPSDLSMCRLFPGSAYSSWGDLHSLAASTSGGSSTFPRVETESFSQTYAGGTP